jgi:hypothetical protein
MAFTVSKQQSGDKTIFILGGNLDEQADLSQVKIEQNMNVVLDVNDITLISSMGVRNWVVFIKNSPVPKILYIRNMQQAFVNLLNTVGNILPRHVIIDSFYVPFVCPECVASQEILLRANTNFNLGSTDVKLPEPPQCNECQVAMEVDVLVPSYFEFLKYFGPA